MRILSATLLLGLLLPAARAQEGGDATAQLPKGAHVAFRIASFDRIDALAKEWTPILKGLGLGAQVAPLEQMPASAFLFTLSGLNAEIVDRTKPMYMGLVDWEQPVIVLHPAEGAAWDGKKELRDGAFAVLRGGAIVAGEPGMLEVEARGAPTKFHVDGDAVVHFYLADILAEHKEEIEQGATTAAMAVAAQGAIPEEARALILPVVTAVKDGLMSLESFDYGATWMGDRMETEGFLAIREGSGLRNLLKRVGAPGNTDLVTYLPKEAYMTVSASMNPDWPAKELKALLEGAGGGDIANALMQVVSMSSAFDAHRTGHTAAAVNMSMMMSMNMLTLTELKPGTDPKTVIDALDYTKINEGLKKVGFPITYTLEKAVGKHGEIDLHRLTMASEDPDMAMMFAGMGPACIAVHKDILFMAMSPTAEDDVKVLLDKVDRGEKDAEHPHLKAMRRLGRGCNIGMTINLGALKPMVMMFGMMGVPREVAQAAQNMPDVLPLSTAITFPDGNVRWRGDWPVKEFVKIAEGVVGEGKGEGAPTPDDEEEFD